MLDDMKIIQMRTNELLSFLLETVKRSNVILVVVTGVNILTILVLAWFLVVT
jgi:hypothetical protein